MISRAIFDQFTIIRQSPILLLFRLLIMDLILVLGYLILYFPFQALYVFFTNGAPEGIMWFDVGMFALASALEMMLILAITLTWMNEYYVIRVGVIHHRRGVFHLHEDTFSLKNVEAFTVNQTFIQKIFRYGDIQFYSPVLKQEYYLKNVAYPIELKEFIEELVIREDSPQRALVEKIIPKSA